MNEIHKPRRLEFTHIIAASPKAVFGLTFDPRSKLLRVPAIRQVELESVTPIGLGTHYLASAGIGPVEFVFREQIMEWFENQHVAYGEQSLWGEFKTIVNIEPHKTGTRIIYLKDYIFPGGRIGSWIGRVLTGLYRQRVKARTVSRFNEIIEKIFITQKVNKQKCLLSHKQFTAWKTRPSLLYWN